MACTCVSCAWDHPENKRRVRSLARFGRRYFGATKREHHNGHDYRMQAVKTACRIAGPLSYRDITHILTGWSLAEEDLCP